MYAPLKRCLVLAGLVTAAALQANPQNLAGNGEMTEGLDRPTGWKVWRDTKHGRVELTRDTEIFRSPPAALKLSSLAEIVSSSTSLPLTLPPDTRKIRVMASARAIGPNLKETVIAIQSFDAADQQVAWGTVAPLIPSGDWLEYEGEVKIPSTAVGVRLVVTLKGQGSVWLDDVVVQTVATP